MKKQQINSLKEQFILSKHITHLNHGSFGACPKPIFDNYQFWQLKLEQEPVNFYVHEGMQHLEKSREVLSSYVNCKPQNIVFTTTLRSQKSRGGGPGPPASLPRPPEPLQLKTVWGIINHD
mgnify:CR=1 FL=1